jgi:hypothetical protein
MRHSRHSPHFLATLMLVAAFLVSASALAVDYDGVVLDFSNGQSVGTAWLWSSPGLVTVDLEYPGTDHNVREIRALPASWYEGGWERMQGLLRDKNGDDPYRGTLRWAVLDSATSHYSSGLMYWCRGTCRLGVQRAPAGQVFLLAGFRFLVQDGGDIRIREIAVQPNPAAGYVDVTFTDDGRSRVYAAEVAYAYVPASAVERTGFTSGTASFGSGRQNGERSVVQGFRLAYLYGEHALRRLTIDLSDDVVMRMQDANNDDAISWSIDYAVLAD